LNFCFFWFKPKEEARPASEGEKEQRIVNLNYLQINRLAEFNPKAFPAKPISRNQHHYTKTGQPQGHTSTNLYMQTPKNALKN
jgi:hypothetical protein